MCHSSNCAHELHPGLCHAGARKATLNPKTLACCLIQLARSPLSWLTCLLYFMQAINEYQIEKIVPFNPVDKYTSVTYVSPSGKHMQARKGAPQVGAGNVLWSCLLAQCACSAAWT